MRTVCVCEYVHVCMVVAVAQQEQLHSAPHTSFVSGLSWLPNGATPPSSSTELRPMPGTGVEHLGASGGGQSLLSLHVVGEGLRSVGQG